MVLPLFNEEDNIDKVFKVFPRIDYFQSNRSNDILNDYENIQKSSVKIGSLFLVGNTQIELETLTNPEYLKERVEILTYRFNRYHELNDKIVSNISKIHPVTFRLILHERICPQINYLSILAGLPNTTKFEVKYIPSLKEANLKFKDVFIKIYEPKQNKSIVIKCKKLECDINISKYHNVKIYQSKCIKNCATQSKCLALGSFCDMQFTGISSLLSSKEKAEADKFFNKFDKAEIQSAAILVPMECLETTELYNGCLARTMDHSCLPQSLLMANQSKVTLDLYDISLFEESVAKLPSSCAFTLTGNHYQEQSDEEIIPPSSFPNELELNRYLKVFEKMKIEQISNLKLTHEYVYQFLLSVLDLKNVKDNLKIINIELPKISNCIELLNLCINFRSIHEIKLKYITQNCTEDTLKDIKKTNRNCDHIHIEITQRH